jgi:3-isopropylmalate/(R)-2-methylmalate dehydratase small subunit
MSGKAWVFGDNLDTDMLAPGIYMKFGIEEIAKHCLEALEPRFATEVKPGDIVVGGKNFGMGSSREQAAGALRHLGVAAVIAPSYAGLFYRNAFNLGLPLLVCADAGSIRANDFLHVEPDQGRITNQTQNTVLACEAIPPHLMAMVRDGGLLGHLEKRLKRQKDAAG